MRKDFKLHISYRPGRLGATLPFGSIWSGHCRSRSICRSACASGRDRRRRGRGGQAIAFGLDDAAGGSSTALAAASCVVCAADSADFWRGNIRRGIFAFSDRLGCGASGTRIAGT